MFPVAVCDCGVDDDGVRAHLNTRREEGVDEFNNSR